jgi:hypothetical protein
VVLGTSTPGARLIALDKLAQRGVEPFYDEAMGLIAWEEMIVEARGLCATLREMSTMFEAVAATMCLGALIFPPMAAECFAATVVLTAIKLLTLIMMC